jgi:hypothetical protein
MVAGEGLYCVEGKGINRAVNGGCFETMDQLSSRKKEENRENPPRERRLRKKYLVPTNCEPPWSQLKRTAYPILSTKDRISYPVLSTKDRI